jgi:hypothetical protein
LRPEQAPLRALLLLDWRLKQQLGLRYPKPSKRWVAIHAQHRLLQLLHRRLRNQRQL